jgi:diguanylate cyclase (GGDEF)-like protein
MLRVVNQVRSDSLAEAQLHALVKVAAGVAGAHRLDDVLELAAESALAAIDAASLSIGRWEAGDVVTLINVGELSAGEERSPRNERYPLSDFPTTLSVLAGGGWMIAAVDDPATDPAHRKLLRTVEKETSLTVPIVFESRTWGEFWVASRIGGRRLVEADSVFIRAVADQIAAAIGRAELFAQVEALAYTDPLTGLANRRVLEDALERACDASTGVGSPALFLCDIDGLKAINDSYGHDAGDRVIRSVAVGLRDAAARHPDAVTSRVGGDEFCVLLPTGDTDDALALCRSVSAQLRSDHGGAVGISCGIAALGPDLDRPAALLRSADAAQYRAKRARVDAPVEAARAEGTEEHGVSEGDRAYRSPSRARRELADELLELLTARNGTGAEELLARMRRRLEGETP